MNPRTASRATANWLLDNIPESFQPQCNTHAGPEVLRSKYNLDVSEYTSYQTVRHPCDLLTSHYYGNIPKDKWPSMWSWLRDGAPAGELIVNGSVFWRFGDTYGTFRFENLQRLTEYFRVRYSCDEVKPMLHDVYHKTHSRKDQNWHDVWSSQMLDWAQENLKWDLTNYGYRV